MPLPRSISTLLALLPLTALCNPAIHHGLAARDNKYHIHCGNAPGTIAGGVPTGTTTDNPFTGPIPNPFPLSGSNWPWMTYLWCTPGTDTYIFFGIGDITPPPVTPPGNIITSLNSSLTWLSSHMAQDGDGPIASPYTPSEKYYSLDAKDGSNYAVFAQSSVGTLTFGILHSALEGLREFMSIGQSGQGEAYNKGNNPIVFQINDGQWGEVGIGYVGWLGYQGQDCVVAVQQGKVTRCYGVGKGEVIN